eukprot:TRINITY_DN14_c0_g1_i1.p2 TRINITY_DN14_c0_g1~~TRINITY_DN14_c0_g1_i1.p2  ORF type:complete len:117 (-),score=24.70 TRINITY_DN14_c0_g1_i1:129-479(-)
MKRLVFLCLVVYVNGKNLLARDRQQNHAVKESPEAERAAREAWLSAHLPDHFEMKDGRLAPQSGLSIAWNHDDIKLRNAKHDCGDAPGAVQAAWAKTAANAVEQGRLSAVRHSATR